mmetsp:Transcript_24738/g.34566  ORF Transcript_24738/g.34566 Transcript_24738/m.34566 type:complete len:144 (-) Transcript_24738:843-1274(-)
MTRTMRLTKFLNRNRDKTLALSIIVFCSLSITRKQLVPPELNKAQTTPITTDTNPRQLDPAETHALNLLNPANEFLYPVYTDGCCGIGHRLSNVVPTLVYANKQRRTAKVCWSDISWSSLFNDTQYVQGSQACSNTELSNIAL